ncbi:hypothetical protein JKP88DRAFT_318667 [Tribonema minus]|uniref:Uncharacterized protein n=1 Tax=Tribonema minus TaxID=303371 RepID=A0A835Z3W2_9STRA|nr:hypothetical protein JKP88DRAFT_318667 [Tribonema minus]
MGDAGCEQELRNRDLSQLADWLVRIRRAEAGRIPNATKFRSYPCLSRCVFLHDPRLRSTPASRDVSGTTTPEALSTPASSRASTPLSTGKGGSRCESRGGVLGTGPSSGLGMRAARDFFYWPDVVREPIPEGEPSPSTSTSSAPRRAKLPACEATYELSSAMADPDKTGDVTGAAVYHLWYSLVETVLDEKGIPTETAANGRPAVAPTHLPIFQQLATGEMVAPPDMPMPDLQPSKRDRTSAFATTLITQGRLESNGGGGSSSSSSSGGGGGSSSEAMLSSLSNAAGALFFNRDVPHGFALPLLRPAQPQQQLHQHREQQQQQQQQLSMASIGVAAALEQQLLQWRQQQHQQQHQQQQQQQRGVAAAALLNSRFALVPSGAATITPLRL